MKKWILKAIVQKTISFFPFGNRVNYFFQKYVTKGVRLSDEYFLDRLEHGRVHIKSYQQYSGNTIPKQTLEIGTGWYPIVPICLFLVGAEKIYSVDISFLTSKQKIKTTLDKFVECATSGLLRNYIEYIPERLEAIFKLHATYLEYSMEEILQKLHINYLVEDATQLSLKADSIDLVNSNNTFEHIYPSVLIPILRDFRRVVNKQNGVMSHFIDMSDHFAHFDKSISIYNFLQFSDFGWSIIDNSIQPQSRLRFDDYQKIYADLQIPISEKSFRAGDLDELKTITLAEKYNTHTPSSIAISHCHFISKFD